MAEQDPRPPITPSSSRVKGREASRASRPGPAGGQPPAKRQRAAHHGPSSAKAPGFSTGRQVFRSVQEDAGEDWGDDGEDDGEDGSAPGSDVDVEDGIIDEEDLDDDDIGGYDDDIDGLAGEV